MQEKTVDTSAQTTHDTQTHDTRAEHTTRSYKGDGCVALPCDRNPDVSPRMCLAGLESDDSCEVSFKDALVFDGKPAKDGNTAQQNGVWERR